MSKTKSEALRIVHSAAVTYQSNLLNKNVLLKSVSTAKLTRYLKSMRMKLLFRPALPDTAQILTLSTCVSGGGDGERVVVQGRLRISTIYPFA